MTVKINNDPGFEIGSIVYIKDDKTPKITPAIITERSYIETLNETKYNYKASYDTKTSFLIAENMIVFKSIDDLREYLAEQVTTMVSKIVKKAESDTQKLQQHKENNIIKSDQQIPEVITKKNSETNSVERVVILPDGTKQKVIINIPKIEN